MKSRKEIVEIVSEYYPDSDVGATVFGVGEGDHDIWVTNDAIWVLKVTIVEGAGVSILEDSDSEDAITKRLDLLEERWDLFDKKWVGEMSEITGCVSEAWPEYDGEVVTSWDRWVKVDKSPQTLIPPMFTPEFKPTGKKVTVYSLPNEKDDWEGIQWGDRYRVDCSTLDYGDNFNTVGSLEEAIGFVRQSFKEEYQGIKELYHNSQKFKEEMNL